MSFIFNTQFKPLYLSAQLPESVEFSSQVENDKVQVEVVVDSEIAMETVLYGFGHDFFLHDIRSVIEEAIRLKGRACASCWIRIENDEESAQSQAFEVVLSEFDIPEAEEFLYTHFLTTRSSFRIHRTGKQLLSWYTAENNAEDYYIDALILPEGAKKPRVLRWKEGRVTAVNRQVMEFLVEVPTVAAYFEQAYPDKKGRLLCFTVHRGLRAMTFYVTEEVPDLKLVFRNAFNVKEHAEIYGVSNRKQKVERSEAHCLYNRVFYDQTTEQTYEVETAALQYEEALWLSQMVASHYVALPAPDGREVEVLITDSTSEISDSDKEQNRLKFSYKFAVDKQHLAFSPSGNIFSEEFRTQFK